MGQSRVETAVAALRRGHIIVVADDCDRENEGDLIIAAECMTREAMAFFVRYTSGVVCAPLTEARLAELSLPLMVNDNRESQRTAFSISVDYRHGTSTGISASDRSATIRALANRATRADDFARPGHVFPLAAREGGVLTRRGHTEAALDLARLAGFSPAAALCELVRDDGEMLRGDELERFAAHHGLEFLTIEELVAFRRRTELQPATHAQARIPARLDWL